HAAPSPPSPSAYFVFAKTARNRRTMQSDRFGTGAAQCLRQRRGRTRNERRPSSMAIVFGAIAPHGFTIIPEMSEDAEGGLKTRAAMEELQRRLAAAAPDVVVIAGPHGFRVEGTICLADVGRGAGTLSWKGRQAHMNVPLHR